jgi:hypothetical protein
MQKPGKTFAMELTLELSTLKNEKRSAKPLSCQTWPKSKTIREIPSRGLGRTSDKRAGRMKPVTKLKFHNEIGANAHSRKVIIRSQAQTQFKLRPNHMGKTDYAAL